MICKKPPQLTVPSLILGGKFSNMAEKELDKRNCGECWFFKYKDGGRFGYIPNKTGEGSCDNPNLLPGMRTQYDFTPRQALNQVNLKEAIQNLDAAEASCFKFRGLEFSDEALEAFYPTTEDRTEWQRLYGINDSTI